MSKIAMAVAAHPDDIEFMMSGTFYLLGQAGYKLHYMNIANGCCGSVTMDAKQTADTRTEEARTSAKSIGAVYHEPLVDDLMVLYDDKLIRKLCAIVREVSPEILLLPSPQDYMEDHMNASRLMVTAAFCRNMPNYATNPETPSIDNQMCLYHALPMGLCDQLRGTLVPDFCVNVTDVMDIRRQMLSCHVSQRQWLDDSQGQDDYVNTLVDMAAQVGKIAGKFTYAEGWRRHSHLGFADEDFDPLAKALSDRIVRI